MDGNNGDLVIDGIQEQLKILKINRISFNIIIIVANFQGNYFYT